MRALHKKFIFTSIAVIGTVSLAFLYVRFQAQSATVSRPGVATSNTQIFAFPARSGKSTFDIVSLPETNYQNDDKKGSALFSAWDGTSTAANYMNLVHTGQNSDRSDNFLLQFFNQTQCITDPSGNSIPGNLLSKKFTATFTKPNLTPTQPGTPVTRITIRAYDHFEVVWGNGALTVTITRYWRAITLPEGVTAETFKPNDYFIEQPLYTDVASPQPVVATLPYAGDFAPFSTKILHGQPYDIETYDRPADVLVDRQKNIDFNFFDIETKAEGEDTKPDKEICFLNVDTSVAEKTEPCGCLNNNSVKACGDPVIPYVDLWPPVQFDFVNGTSWLIGDPNDLNDAIAAYGEQFAGDGTVTLDLNTYDASNGNGYNLHAMQFGFKTEPVNSYFSWCFNGKSQQGLVAGGDWISDTRASIATKDADSSGCCDLVTRTPSIDANNDGVDDQWQLRFGYILTGDKGYMLPANYDGDASGSKALTPLSGDGYVADSFLDINGERIAVTPGSVNAKTGKKYVTGDGEFTAAEEYIWGTDPTQFDTDQDGYPDEADIVGLGQNKIDFVSPLQPRDFPNDQDPYGNDRFNVKIKTLARMYQLRTKEDQATSGSDSPNITRVAEETKDVFSRDPGEMSVSLEITPESPGLYDTFTASTSLTMGDRAGGNPIFSWYAKRIPGIKNNPGTGQPNGEQPLLQGESLSLLEKTVHDICPECQPGDKLQITVQVNDTVRGAVAVNKASISVGGTNSLQIFQDCNKDGADDEVGSSTYCFASKQVTKNIPVRVAASFLDLDPNQYYFQWRLDNTLQTSNCLPAAVSSTTPPVACSFGTNQMVFTPKENQAKYVIDLLVYRNDRPDVPPAQFNPTPSAEVAHFETTIESGIPAVTIVFEPAPATFGGAYPVGSSITARAKVDFLNPTPKGQLVVDPKVPGSTDGAKALRYVWKNAQNQILKVDEIPSIDGSTVTLKSNDPAVSELFVDVVSPDYFSSTDQSVPIVVSGRGITYFQNGPAVASLRGKIQAQLASVLSFIPEPLMQVVRIMAVIAFATVIILLFANIPHRRRKG